jgi:hypothetical protein
MCFGPKNKSWVQVNSSTEEIPEYGKLIRKIFFDSNAQ